MVDGSFAIKQMERIGSKQKAYFFTMLEPLVRLRGDGDLVASNFDDCNVGITQMFNG